MMFKTFLASAALLACGLANAADPIVLDLSGDSANFTGSLVSQSYLFDLAEDMFGLGGVTSSYGSKSGYHITRVTFDGVELANVSAIPHFDNFVLFDGAIGAGQHTFTVTGLARGGSFTGNLEVTAVPEPESYGLALSGLALVGYLMSRRQRHVA